MRNPTRTIQLRSLLLARRRNSSTPHTQPVISQVDARASWQEARHTPRMSLIVILGDNEPFRTERIDQELHESPLRERDVIFACAGRPANLMRLSRRVHDAQFLFAPPGTSAEDLRELAMKRARGDIVTLVDGMRSGASLGGERYSAHLH